MASNASTPPAQQEPTRSQQSYDHTHTHVHAQDQDPSSTAQTPLPLPLPEPSSASTQLNVNGEGIKLDHLGPLVVNKDGSLSRIANWDKMAEIERQNTLRILGKRNQLRLGALKGEGGSE